MPDDDEVADLADRRLAGLRMRERALANAEAHLVVVEVMNQVVNAEYLWALRTALDARADGTPVEQLERDLDLEATGAAAHDAIEAQRQAVADMRHALGTEIGEITASNTFAVGDTVHSPTGATLIVAEIFQPSDPTLTEVTMTEDGKPIVKRQHSWPLGRDFRPIRDDVPLIKYERWGAGRLRVAGRVHAESRQIVND